MLHRESCAGCREAFGEALTAARVGGALSTETLVFLSAEAFRSVEGNTGHDARDESWTGSAVSKHSRHARTSDIGTWEIFASSGRVAAGIAEGRQKAEAEDARGEEVRRGHSSREGGEQAGGSPGGAAGAKGRDQREDGR